MGNFSDKLISIIDKSAKKAQEVIEEASNSFDEMNWNEKLDDIKACKDRIIRRGNEWLREFDGLMEKVKDTFKDFTVTVPFDKDNGEQISYDFTEDGKYIVINVSFADDSIERTNRTKLRLPEDCDTEHCTMTINKTHKLAVFTIPKKEPTDDVREEEAETESESDSEISESVEDMELIQFEDADEQQAEQEAPTPQVEEEPQEQPQEEADEREVNEELARRLEANLAKVRRSTRTAYKPAPKTRKKTSATQTEILP